tara:strand:- start:7528 stop:8016 length:489 start_codon:yes stop_codon:yes gene_type:complete
MHFIKILILLCIIFGTVLASSNLIATEFEPVSFMSISKAVITAAVLTFGVLFFGISAPVQARSSASSLLTPVSGTESAAVRTWRTAAERGDSKAQFMLGMMHSRGLGTTLDLMKAYVWFKISSERHPPSIRQMRYLEKRLSKTKIALSDALIAEWKASKRTN